LRLDLSQSRVSRGTETEKTPKGVFNKSDNTTDDTVGGCMCTYGGIIGHQYGRNASVQ